MKNAAFVVAAAAVLCAGCSGKMAVNTERLQKKRNGEITTMAHGIPIPSLATYVEFYNLTKSSKGGDCSHVPKYRIVALPDLENPMYVNVDSGPFADVGLTVKYNERGAVTEVAFNSAPSGEGMEAATAAASTLLPFLGVVAKTTDAAAAATDTATEAKMMAEAVKSVDGTPRSELKDALTRSLKADIEAKPACDAGEVIDRLVPASKFFKPS